MIMAENELIIIDCIEKIRNHLFACDPSLEKIFENLQNTSLTCKTEDLIRESYLSVVLNINIDAAIGRRKIRHIIKEISEYDFHSCQESINPYLKHDFYHLTDKEKEKFVRNFQAVTNIFDCLNAIPQNEINWLALIKDLVSGKTGLNAIKTYRFLKLLGAPVAVLETRKRKFLFRLGWLNVSNTNSKSLTLYQNFCSQLSRLCNESIQSLDYLFGLFSGSEKTAARDAPMCGEKPLCSKCPLANYCHYFQLIKAESIGEDYDAQKIARQPKELPREKLLLQGAPALSVPELLAVLLRTGTRSLSVMDLSNTLINKLGSLRAIEAATIKELCAIKGIGLTKAAEIKAAIELGKRFSQEKKRGLTEIKESRAVYDQYRLRFTNYKQEVFLMLVLNSRNEIMREVEISKGTLNSCTVHPREAFKEAIRDSGAGVIFIHNHPSGHPAPSRADIMLTERLQKAGEILGIRVVDHIIIGDGAYYSFADEGLIS